MLVENWMATNVIAVKPDTSLLKCRNLLKEHQIRRLPVVDDQNWVSSPTETSRARRPPRPRRWKCMKCNTFWQNSRPRTL